MTILNQKRTHLKSVGKNAPVKLLQIPYCWKAADDANACQFLGYMKDGFPAYGRCNHEGVELVSCWNQIAGTTGDNERDFEFDSAAYNAGTCHLD